MKILVCDWGWFWCGEMCMVLWDVVVWSLLCGIWWNVGLVYGLVGVFFGEGWVSVVIGS